MCTATFQKTVRLEDRKARKKVPTRFGEAELQRAGIVTDPRRPEDQGVGNSQSRTHGQVLGS